MIFLRLQLVNWGGFDGHEFRLDAPVVDFVGENGSGKTTILDALNVVLNLAEELFRGRSLGSFQRDPSRPSFIALTVANPQRASGRRAFPQYDATFTVLTRINTEQRAVQQYAIFNGDTDITRAIEESESKKFRWMTTSQYEEKWHLAGYRKTDRKNRMFGHKRPEKVRDSTPRQLYELFETLTNNAENVAALAEARQDFETAKQLLEEAKRTEAALRNERNLKAARQTEYERTLGNVRELANQRSLLQVARYKSAKASFDADVAARGTDIAKRSALTEEKTSIAAKLPKLKRDEALGRTAHDQFQAKRANNAQNREQLIRTHTAAKLAAAAAEEEQREFAALAEVPATSELNAARIAAQTELERINQRRGVVIDQQRRLRETIHDLTAYGIPLEAHHGATALESADIAFTRAWQILPSERDMLYEEAMGDARYGILLAQKKDLQRAISILRQHQFPGPISTLTQDEYVKIAEGAWTPTKDGYATPLGIHLLTGKPAVLNPKLLEQQRTLLQNQLQVLAKEERGLTAERDEVTRKADAIVQHLAKAKRRDALAPKTDTWSAAIANYTEKDREFPQHMRLYDEIDEHARQAEIAYEAARRLLTQATGRVAEIDQQLASLRDYPDPALQATMDAAWQACQGVYEKLKDEAQSSSSHESSIAKLDGALAKATIPSETEVSELIANVSRLDEQITEQTAFVLTKQAIYAETERNHNALVLHMQATIEDAYKRVKQDVESLAHRVGFEARLHLNRQEAQWTLEYEVAFHKDAQGRWLFKPIKNPADSTGEGAKAALVFCLAMSDPSMEAWYFLDEPAANFSPKNVRHMFDVLSRTNAQVILTSTRDQDYGDEADIWQHTLFDFVDGVAPQPSKNRYSNKGIPRDLPQTRL